MIRAVAFSLLVLRRALLQPEALVAEALDVAEGVVRHGGVLHGDGVDVFRCVWVVRVAFGAHVGREGGRWWRQIERLRFQRIRSEKMHWECLVVAQSEVVSPERNVEGSHEQSLLPLVFGVCECGLCLPQGITAASGCGEHKSM